MQIHLSALRQQLVRSILGRKPNVFPPVCSPIYLYQQANLQMIMKAKMLTALAWRMGPEESRCVRGLCIISDRTQRSHTVSTTAECVGKASFFFFSYLTLFVYLFVSMTVAICVAYVTNMLSAICCSALN